jgi:parallel beta-helix repeat protein
VWATLVAALLSGCDAGCVMTRPSACAGDRDCAYLANGVCVAGDCRRACDRDEACVANEVCAQGLCTANTAAVCDGNEACTTPPACRVAQGATCVGGACRYAGTLDDTPCHFQAAPPAPADGVCRSGQCQAVAGHRCATNADCGEQVCIGAACVAPSAFGGPCDLLPVDESDCAAGLRCVAGECLKDLGAPCSENSECADHCVAAVCTVASGVGGPCDAGDDSDCAGLVCNANAVCEAAAACADNDACAALGLTCIAGFCQHLSSTGGACDDAADCAAALTCQAGVCARAPGGSCSHGGECATGFCVDGVCCHTACAGNCDRCDTSGDGTCVADDSRCGGSCGSCSTTTGNCQADAARCTGDCATCAGAGTAFDCAADATQCGADCTCGGSGVSFSCDCAVADCADGAITSQCRCGGALEADGYCCAGVHQGLACGAGTVFYVDAAGGNDASDGRSPSSAWQTLTRVNAASLTAGTQILLKRNSTFYGSLSLDASGAPSSPIAVGTYGTGAPPLITGFTTVSAWIDLGGNRWESAAAVSTLATCNVVAVNGVNTPMGRYPNDDTASGWLTVTSHAGSTSMTSTGLSGTPDWTGAEAVIRAGDFIMNRATITSQSGGTLTLSPPNGDEPIDGFGFFIQDDARTLDRQDEWYFSPSTKKITIYSTTQPTDVRVAAIENLLTINGSHITIDGIDFSGANTNAIHTTSTTLTDTNIRNCHVAFSGRTGIKVRSDYLTVTNNVVIASNNRAIDLNYSQHVLVNRNTIRDSGVLPGMAEKHGWEGIWAALYVGNIVGLNCEYNTIVNAGQNAISFGGPNSDAAVINNNLLDTFCSVLDDCGGIYGGTRSTIERNVVINGIGAWRGTASTGPGGPAMGIYLDDNSQYNQVLNNSVGNVAMYGIYLHNASHNIVSGNTVYNAATQIHVRDDNITGTIDNNAITGNLFVARASSQLAAEYGWPAAPYYSIGTLDNNYYARPAGVDDDAIRLWFIDSAANYTLAYWQTFSGQDLNSHTSAVTIANENDLRFEYNASASAVTISLAHPMIDVMGNKYPSSIVLQPYASAVLMVDPNP